ncbi:zinc-dependent alcohol dehydrogenase [Salinigranum salinum]|uniref:zinc-dependent alcohol dehydrogenase n=1 Tax=Salinigranum salinum TaxID=1364937 RepID=UPI0012608768|nr:alcohol dehydrogenase catalytic domain-containing protein [Salinigranum salinum]
MKAIVQTGPETVELQEHEEPSPGDGEVLVRVHTAGICGSDAHAYRYEGGYEWIKLPRIMGHEYSGTVAAVGDDVDTLDVGDRVIEEPIHDCGHCFQCKNGQSNVCQNFSITGLHRDGAYAEYTVVEPRHLHAIPDGVPLGHAAITEPTSIATRAVFDQSRTTPGDDVLVEGPGPIGVLVATVADSIGANVLVSGLSQDETARLPIVEELGIQTLNSDTDDIEAHRETFTDGRGFDIVFDTTGHRSGVEMATDQVRKGGQIVVVGLPGEPSELFMTPLVRGEVDLNTSYGSMWSNFEQALRLMENGTIDTETIVDDSYTVSDPTSAFESFLNAEAVKPVFRFEEGT